MRPATLSALSALCALLLIAAPPAGSQAPQPAAGDAALVRELLALSGAERQYEQMLAIMTDNMRIGFTQGFAESLKGKALDAAKRERAQAIADRYFEDLQREITTEMRRVMPYDKLVNDVYGPLYLKYFTRAEITEATVFYRSPTGRKFADSTPQLMQDTSRILNERYLPQLVRSMSQQMDRSMKRMIEELGRL